MRVQCPRCNKAYSIPDEKLPAAPSAFTCTACGEKVVVQPPASRAEALDAVPLPASAAGQAGPLLSEEQMDALRHEVTKEILRSLGLAATGQEGQEDEEETLAALVCEDEDLFQNVIGESLSKLKYRCDVAPTAKASLERLAAVPYSMVTVDSRFPDDPEGGYKILQAINALPPERRRKMFVAFISADLSTMDLNSAFILGANVTVGKKDIKRLDKILSEGIKEHEQRYRVFLQAEQELNNEKI